MKKLWLLLAGICFLSFINNISAEEPMEYLESSKAVPQGKAPGLKVKLLSDFNGIKHYVLVFADGDEVLSGVTDFATKYNVKDAHFTAIGALKKSTSGWYDASKKAYKLNHIDQQAEIVSLIGNISLFNDKPVVHAHFAVGFADGKVEGGHLIEAYTFPTVEMFITVEPTPLQKHPDQETGLNLIDPNS